MVGVMIRDDYADVLLKISRPVVKTSSQLTTVLFLKSDPQIVRYWDDAVCVSLFSSFPYRYLTCVEHSAR